MSEVHVVQEGTEISAANLTRLGYKEYRDFIDKCDRAFQKFFYGDDGRRKYSVEFRLWVYPNGRSWDCHFSTKTDTADGYIWVTLSEKTIELCEKRCEAIWGVTGAVMYD